MKKSVGRNAILNVVRQVSTIVFSVISFPYISRVIQPDNYGKISFSTTFVSYFSLIAAMGISNYAIREGAKIRDDKGRLNKFVNEIFTINIISTIFAYFLLLITLFLWWQGLKIYFLLIFIQSLLIFVTTIGVEWVYGIYEDYYYITVRNVVVQLISIVLIFLLIRSRNDYIMYAVILLVASGGGYIFNFVHVSKYVTLKIVKKINLRKHLKPILFLFASSLLISIYVSSDITLLGVFGTNKEVGVYTVSVKIYTIMKQFLNAVVAVILPSASHLIGNKLFKKYNILLDNILQTIIFFAIPLTALLIVNSKNIILLISGTDYLSGVMALRILSLATVPSLIASFFVTTVLLPYNKEEKIFIITIASAIFNVLLNLFMIPIWGINGAAFTTFMAETLVAFFSVIYSRRLITIKLVSLSTLQVITGSFIVGFICYVTNLFNLYYLYSLILSSTISICVYLIIMKILRNSVFHAILKKIKGE
ncbi:flippase [Liquorilactobacillus mali]|uniref:flippase n=1 Tax=Liquorilactobacillus mali TaxID=1618 RepID=UPI0002491693|nr:flippase [Liquorilactobacillus mali]QFQ74444.1 flippase [Liquorilactobacillus mali]